MICNGFNSENVFCLGKNLKAIKKKLTRFWKYSLKKVFHECLKKDALLGAKKSICFFLNLQFQTLGVRWYW